MGAWLCWTAAAVLSAGLALAGDFDDPFFHETHEETQERWAREREQWDKNRAKESEQWHKDRAKESEQWDKDRAKEKEERDKDRAKKNEEWNKDRAKESEQWDKNRAKAKETFLIISLVFGSVFLLCFVGGVCLVCRRMQLIGRMQERWAGRRWGPRPFPGGGFGQPQLGTSAQPTALPAPLQPASPPKPHLPKTPA